MGSHPWLLAFAVTMLVAGCFQAEVHQGELADGRMTHVVDDLTFRWAPGALSAVEAAREASIALTGGARFTDPGFPTQATLGAGEARTFIAPPGALDLEVEIDGASHVLAGQVPLFRSDELLLDGGRVVSDMAFLRDNLPSRHPGHENYEASFAWAAERFRSFGYDVELDPYGTHGATIDGTCVFEAPTGAMLCPESLANVVATKPGTNGKMLLVGAHFDTVPGTVEGAFDNTAGSMLVLEMARALAPFEFEHSLVFALWGGEENGLLGSNFWVQNHPEARTALVTAWNFDVVGQSWPAPVADPDPYMFVVGPNVPNDAGPTVDPIAQSLASWALELRDLLGFPATAMTADGEREMFLTAEAVRGSTNSDHAAFLAAGVPTVHMYHLGPSVAKPHTRSDTLTNMTKYAYFGEDFIPSEPWPDAATALAGKQALADSLSTPLWFAAMHMVYVDAGLYVPPTR